MSMAGANLSEKAAKKMQSMVGNGYIKPRKTKKKRQSRPKAQSSKKGIRKVKRKRKTNKRKKKKVDIFGY
jgi:hypothetical protein